MNVSKTISLKLLNKEFQIACPDDAEEALYSAAAYLNEKVRDIRKTGRVLGSERMAIMAALNIAYEFNQFKKEQEAYVTSIKAQIKQLQTKIENALMEESAE